MKPIKQLWLVSLSVLGLSIPVAQAQSSDPEQGPRFILRAGPAILSPTASGTINGQNTELDTAGGGTLSFEWMFDPKWGLEATATGVADVESIGNDTDGGISVSPFTVGLNYHPVQTDTIDWSTGFLMGSVRYGDFTFKDDDFAVTVDQDFTYGLQTGIDVAPAHWKHWGFNTGVTWLKTSADFKNSPGSVAVDPLIWRFLLIYRW